MEGSKEEDKLGGGSFSEGDRSESGGLDEGDDEMRGMPGSYPGDDDGDHDAGHDDFGTYEGATKGGRDEHVERDNCRHGGHNEYNDEQNGEYASPVFERDDDLPQCPPSSTYSLIVADLTGENQQHELEFPLIFQHDVARCIDLGIFPSRPQRPPRRAPRSRR
jgi:hypothetical protein